MVARLVSIASALLLATGALAAPISLELRSSSGACSPEGMVVCLGESSFQQCASGMWQTVQSVAAGTTCTGIFGKASTVSGAGSPSFKPIEATTPNAIPKDSTPEAITPPLPFASSSPPAALTNAAPPPAVIIPLALSSPISSAKPGPALAGTISTTGCQTTRGQASTFSGPATNFPAQSSWMCFDDLWTLQIPALKFNDDSTSIDAMHNAITQVAGDSGIDARVILAIIMQESAGNVHVPTTNNGVVNPGIMQSHNGVAFDANQAVSSILQMVRDGTEGTASGPGLKQLHAQFGGYYQAMRAYNSGSVDQNNLSNGLGSTPSYVSDCANRLIGAKLS